MKPLMKLIITLLFLASLLGIHIDNAYAEAQIGKALYQYERYIEEERYEQAEAVLGQYQSDIAALFETLEDEESAELLTILETNQLIVNDSSFSSEYKKNQALTLILAVDAINNSEDPIWMKWKSDLANKIEGLMNSEQVSEGQINSLLNQWQIMKPALRYSLEQNQFNELASSFNQLSQQQVYTGDSEELQTVFQQVQLIDLAKGTNSNTLHSLWLIVIVGGCITLTLSYVAWRKYKGEKVNQKQMTN